MMRKNVLYISAEMTLKPQKCLEAMPQRANALLQVKVLHVLHSYLCKSASVYTEM